jgi:hypothetical protein
LSDAIASRRASKSIATIWETQWFQFGSALTTLVLQGSEQSPPATATAPGTLEQQGHADHQGWHRLQPIRTLTQQQPHQSQQDQQRRSPSQEVAAEAGAGWH